MRNILEAIERMSREHEASLTLEQLAEREQQRCDSVWARQEHGRCIQLDRETHRRLSVFEAGPIKYRRMAAIRLSQLSARSWGAGQDRRGVVHAQVEEAFEMGRLHREKGDFLCDKKFTPWDSADRPTEPVSCKRCLKILERAERHAVS